MSFRSAAIVSGCLLGLTGGTAMAAGPVLREPPASQAIPVAGAPDKSIAAQVETRITSLRAKLLISPEQEPLWAKFAKVMRENAARADEVFVQRVRAMPTMTASENLQSYATVSAQHAEDAKRLVLPFQELYATMTDVQRRAADLVFREDAHRGPSAKRS